ncbi:hypothetical protein BGZ76_011916, partial [Entomortierella beljakovae]
SRASYSVQKLTNKERFELDDDHLVGDVCDKIDNLFALGPDKPNMYIKSGNNMANDDYDQNKDDQSEAPAQLKRKRDESPLDAHRYTNSSPGPSIPPVVSSSKKLKKQQRRDSIIGVPHFANAANGNNPNQLKQSQNDKINFSTPQPKSVPPLVSAPLSTSTLKHLKFTIDPYPALSSTSSSSSSSPSSPSSSSSRSSSSGPNSGSSSNSSSIKKNAPTPTQVPSQEKLPKKAGKEKAVEEALTMNTEQSQTKPDDEKSKDQEMKEPEDMDHQEAEIKRKRGELNARRKEQVAKKRLEEAEEVKRNEAEQKVQPMEIEPELVKEPSSKVASGKTLKEVKGVKVAEEAERAEGAKDTKATKDVKPAKATKDDKSNKLIKELKSSREPKATEEVKVAEESKVTKETKAIKKGKAVEEANELEKSPEDIKEAKTVKAEVKPKEVKSKVADQIQKATEEKKRKVEEERVEKDENSMDLDGPEEMKTKNTAESRKATTTKRKDAAAAAAAVNDAEKDVKDKAEDSHSGAVVEIVEQSAAKRKSAVKETPVKKSKGSTEEASNSAMLTSGEPDAVGQEVKGADSDKEKLKSEDNNHKSAEAKATNELKKKAAEESKKKATEELEKKVAEELEKKAAEELEKKTAEDLEKKTAEESKRKAALEKAALEKAEKAAELKAEKATKAAELKAEKAAKAAELKAEKAAKAAELKAKKAAEDKARRAALAEKKKEAAAAAAAALLKEADNTSEQAELSANQPMDIDNEIAAKRPVRKSATKCAAKLSEITAAVKRYQARANDESSSDEMEIEVEEKPRARRSSKSDSLAHKRHTPPRELIEIEVPPSPKKRTVRSIKEAPKNIEVQEEPDKPESPVKKRGRSNKVTEDAVTENPATPKIEEEGVTDEQVKRTVRSVKSKTDIKPETLDSKSLDADTTAQQSLAKEVVVEEPKEVKKTPTVLETLKVEPLSRPMNEQELEILEFMSEQQIKNQASAQSSLHPTPTQLAVQVSDNSIYRRTPAHPFTVNTPPQRFTDKPTMDDSDSESNEEEDHYNISSVQTKPPTVVSSRRPVSVSRIGSPVVNRNTVTVQQTQTSLGLGITSPKNVSNSPLKSTAVSTEKPTPSRYDFEDIFDHSIPSQSANSDVDEDEDEPLVRNRKAPLTTKVSVPTSLLNLGLDIEIAAAGELKSTEKQVKKEKIKKQKVESESEDSSESDDTSNPDSDESTSSDSSEGEDSSSDKDDEESEVESDKKAEPKSNGKTLLGNISSLKGAEMKGNSVPKFTPGVTNTPTPSRPSSSSDLTGPRNDQSYDSLTEISSMSMNGMKLSSLSQFTAQNRTSRVGTFGSTIPTSSQPSSVNNGGEDYTSDESSDSDDSDDDEDSSEDESSSGPQVKIAGKKRKAANTPATAKAANGSPARNSPMKRKKGGAMDAMFT